MKEIAKTDTGLELTFDSEGNLCVLITQTVECSLGRRECAILLKASDFENMYQTYQERKATAQEVLRILKDVNTDKEMQ